MDEWEKPKTLDGAIARIEGLIEDVTATRERNYNLENYLAVFRMALERIALMDDPAAMRAHARETAELTKDGVGERLTNLSK